MTYHDKWIVEKLLLKKGGWPRKGRWTFFLTCCCDSLRPSSPPLLTCVSLRQVSTAFRFARRKAKEKLLFLICLSINAKKTTDILSVLSSCDPKCHTPQTKGNKKVTLGLYYFWMFPKSTEARGRGRKKPRLLCWRIFPAGVSVRDRGRPEHFLRENNNSGHGGRTKWKAIERVKMWRKDHEMTHTAANRQHNTFRP